MNARQLLTFLSIMLGTTAALAAPTTPHDESSVRRFGDDVFIAGRHVDWSESTTGDAALAGQNVEANGRVGGDALIAGRRVAIGSTIAQDLYAAGADVRLAGSVGNSARVAGGRVVVLPGASIDGGASLAGNRVSIDGHVGRYASVAAGHTAINGRIDGDLTVASGDLSLGPNAVVQGRIDYRGRHPAQIAPGAQLLGGIEQSLVQPWAGGPIGFGLAWAAGWIVAGALLLAAAPRVTRRVTLAMRDKPLASPLLGIALMIATPIVVVILAATVVGLPLGLLWALAFVLLVPLGYLATAAALGDRLAERRERVAAKTWRRALAMALALLVLTALTWLPYVGWLIALLTVPFGIGAMLIAFRRARRDAAAAAPHPA